MLRWLKWLDEHGGVDSGGCSAFFLSSLFSAFISVEHCLSCFASSRDSVSCDVDSVSRRSNSSSSRVLDSFAAFNSSSSRRNSASRRIMSPYSVFIWRSCFSRTLWSSECFLILWWSKSSFVALWACFLETFTPLYKQAYDFLVAIAEPVCRYLSIFHSCGYECYSLSVH